MCGIAAIFAYKPDAPRVNLGELGRLKLSMQKRGPDSEGEWLNRVNSLGLTHTRLAIIDPSNLAVQPMTSVDGKTVISFNGEIYNFRERRKELIQKGYRFNSNSDTEVLLNLYREYGSKMLTKLRGMFAFAIWDDESSTLFCARDIYGIKPLYYSDDGSTLRVASQVRTLLRADIESKERAPGGIVGFYLFGHVPEPFTLYKSIHALPAGYSLTLSAGSNPKIEKYAAISEIYNHASSHRRDTNDALESIEQALTDSLVHHMISDVPVGLFLSAGIDSGLMLALLARAGYEKVRAITVSFDEYADTREDEAPIAARVAKHCGAIHDTVTIGESEIKAELLNFMESMDQPSIDGLNTWLISRAAAGCGLKVALSGIGGDELFGGYPSFSDISRWQAIFGSSKKVPGLNNLAHSLIGVGRRFGLSLSPKLEALPYLADSWAGAYLVRRGLFMPAELEDILGSELTEAGLAELQPVELIESAIVPDPGNAFARTATLESCLYMKNQLLRDTDWAAMDHSLEVRTPLADHTLLAGIASDLKSNAGEVTKKTIARRIGGDLPEEWSVRAKTGFTVPIQKWLESINDFRVWQSVPSLCSDNCHWARRWAYTVMSIAPHASA